MIPCRICNSPSHPVFQALVLGRHEVRYHHCRTCGLLETEEPFWLSEAYADAITVQDTGLVGRNLAFANDVAVLIYCFFDRNCKFVDYAGGTGLFTRLMRDIGFDFRTFDPHARNVHARGFEARPGECGFELATTFESFEHFVRPREELETILAMSRNVVFSTELLPSPPPSPEAWWYYSLAAGQHVAFYEPRTLAFLAREHWLHLSSFGPLHLFTERELPAWRLRLARKLRRVIARRLRRRMQSRTIADHDLLSGQASS
jgi:Methyltransferase domain